MMSCKSELWTAIFESDASFTHPEAGGEVNAATVLTKVLCDMFCWSLV